MIVIALPRPMDIDKNRLNGIMSVELPGESHYVHLCATDFLVILTISVKVQWFATLMMMMMMMMMMVQ
jgi:hypothetical protein